MFETRLLTTNNVAEWNNLLKRLDCVQQDPHYLLEYLQIYERLPEGESKTHFGGEGLLFIYGDDDNFIVYPFFKRHVPTPAQHSSGIVGLYDIASPYGYGGPVAHIKDMGITDKLWKAFFAEFDQFCKERRIVSEFCRLHPFLENNKPTCYLSDRFVRRVNDIVFIDLTRSEEEIARGMATKRRQQAYKSMNNPDLDISFEISNNAPQCFFDIYTQTMQRAKAYRRYYFPLSFFNDTFKILRNHLTLASVSYKGDLIAMGIFIKYGRMAYHWLSGSKSEYFNLHSNVLIISQAISQLKKEGFKYLVLGGGVSGRDSLFEYKAQFSNSIKEHHIYQKIHLEKEYTELVELRGKTEETTDTFFPKYRQP